MQPIRRSIGGLVRSSKPAIRSFSASAGADAPRGKVLPWLIGAVGLGAGSWYLWKGNSAVEDNPVKTASEIIKTFQEPAFEKLLPDKVEDPNHPRPYTLVIDLDKFLVCHLWDREHSKWRIAKRPGAELFLFYASQMYEVVVFSSLPQHEADMIVKKLDPYGCVSHGLYRFATRHHKGQYLKDITKLNRDPSKIIVLGHDIEGFSEHPENMLAVPKWEGDGSDHRLEESVDFLEMLAFSRIKDVRPLISKYANRVFPDHFEAIQEEAFEKTRQDAIESLRKRTSNPILRFLGFASTSPALKDANSSTSIDEKFPTYKAKKAERTMSRRKEWEHVKGLMQKQLEAEMEKEKTFYAEHKMSLWDLFSKGPPPPPPMQAASEQALPSQ